ncbi:MAG: GNAT family N-acetyltransferase [Acidimicrobiales bacterium]|nr:GNAT family N-acetyltransferase [Acidimicrobiales bacterium]
MAVVVRRLEPADRPAWSELWSGYLAFYETVLDAEVTERTWGRLLDPDEPMGALVAVVPAADEVVGLAHHVLHRSTWSPTSYCYLEDLFVAPAHRGAGVARALIEATADAGAAAGATKLYWQTHRTNERARRLYDHVAHHDGFLVYERDLA